MVPRLGLNYSPAYATPSNINCPELYSVWADEPWLIKSEPRTTTNGI